MATGVMPGRFGIWENGSIKRSDARKVTGAGASLGQLMKSAGYNTFYGGKAHMTADLHPSRAGYDKFYRGRRETLPDATLDFVKRSRGKPFFAVASFLNPHDIAYAHAVRNGQRNVPPSVRALYDRASALSENQLPPLPSNFLPQTNEAGAISIFGKRKATTPSLAMREVYSEREWRVYRWMYRRLTEEADGQIARILDGLKESGLEDNTTVLFVSDHGDMDASHQLASKGVMYDESVRVPLLIRHPGRVAAGRVDERLVSTSLDVLPSLCHFAGIDPPSNLLGLPLTSDTATHRYIVAENVWSRMVRTERYKYCVYTEGEPRESLVDMKLDRGETRNLASSPEYADEINRHRAHLREWTERSGDPYGQRFLPGIKEAIA